VALAVLADRKDHRSVTDGPDLRGVVDGSAEHVHRIVSERAGSVSDGRDRPVGEPDARGARAVLPFVVDALLIGDSGRRFEDPLASLFYGVVAGVTNPPCHGDLLGNYID